MINLRAILSVTDKLQTWHPDVSKDIIMQVANENGVRNVLHIWETEISS